MEFSSFHACLLCFLWMVEVSYYEGGPHLMESKQNLLFPVQAVRKGIPILIDAERLREGLDDLLKLTDYLVCSEKFPRVSALFFYFF